MVSLKSTLNLYKGVEMITRFIRVTILLMCCHSAHAEWQGQRFAAHSAPLNADAKFGMAVVMFHAHYNCTATFGLYGPKAYMSDYKSGYSDSVQLDIAIDGFKMSGVMSSQTMKLGEINPTGKKSDSYEVIYLFGRAQQSLLDLMYAGKVLSFKLGGRELSYSLKGAATYIKQAKRYCNNF